jgi:hypothetical protein
MSNTAYNPARVRTAQQVLAQQKADAEKRMAERQQVAPAEQQLPATDDRPYKQRYVDEIAPATFPGKLVKFTKEGAFIVAESDEEISPDKDFVALVDESLVGWIRFEEGAPPERRQGLLYDGFVMPPRESLGDTNPAKWPLGLNGTAEDPWLHQIVVVLEDRNSHDLYSFATTSRTGRRAVGNLFRHYDRLRMPIRSCD